MTLRFRLINSPSYNRDRHERAEPSGTADHRHRACGGVESHHALLTSDDE
jgi:hypothetical protein